MFDNNCVFVGRVTHDLEVKVTNNGNKYVRFSLAVNRYVPKDAPQGTKDADFIRCVAWNKTAELMMSYVRKGSLIGIRSRCVTGDYEDNGRKIYTTDFEVEDLKLLEKKNDGYQPQPTAYVNQQQEEQVAPAFDISRDDLPF